MKLLYGLSLNNNYVIKSDRICDLRSYLRHLFKTGHSKFTDTGLELCTPDFDRLSVPVDAALVTGLSTIASISVISVHSRYHLLGSCLPSGFYCSESRVSTSNVSLLLSFCPHTVHACMVHMQSLPSCTGMSSTQSLSNGTQQ